MDKQWSAAAHMIVDSSTTGSVVLIEHRRALAHNQEAYTYEIVHNSERLIRTLIPHINGSGVSLSPRNHGPSLARAIALLFETQDQRPILYVEGTELPLCWNRPRDWDKAYIKYEWGHLKSKNQNPSDEVGIADMALYSARCNRASNYITERWPYRKNKSLRGFGSARTRNMTDS